MAVNTPYSLTVSTNSSRPSPVFSSRSLTALKLPVQFLSKRLCSVQSRICYRRMRIVRCSALSEEGESLGTVDVLTVPDQWLTPSRASEEAEWLRVTLHKWLDDEYCPEPTNVEISKVAAESYYRSLLQRRTDLGEILLKMARELESISYQESFHGAFSSANAAINLIAERIEQE